MKQLFPILVFLLIGFSSYSQTDSIVGKKFQLTGRIIEKVQMTPHCGIIAWGTVIEFQIIDLVGLTYPNKNIGVIVTCPEFYKDNFFERGKTYQVVFSDKNQAGFGWTIPNKELLSKNSIPFEPYVVSIKKLP
jgi:hypothetical protein